MSDRLGTRARTVVWALLVCGVLLAASVIVQRPDYRADFAAYADRMALWALFAGHVISSIGGTAVGLVGMVFVAFATSITALAVGVFEQVSFLQPLAVIGLAVTGVAIARATAGSREGTVVFDEVTVR
jgi:hypothetical protein